MSRRDTFFEPFDRDFWTLGRRARRGDRSVDLPFVMAHPLDHPRPDELAEFKAGVLVALAPGSQSEAWQIHGFLYRDSKGPPVVGTLTVQHFALDRNSSRAEVTGTVLRGLPLATIRDRALAGLEGILQAREAMEAVGGWNIKPDDVERARQAAREARKPRPGRPGHPNEHYRRIAIRYLELQRVRRDVLVGLAAEESAREGRQIPRETIRDWVRKATERGYLAPGKPGRAEARPGPKLKRKEK